MPYRLLIAVAAGLVSAVVFASATTGPLLMRMVLFLLTPLALFLAGLGLSPVAAAVAGVAGTLLVAAVGSPTVALYFAAGSALPAVILTYLASLNRRAASGDLEWYPIGSIVVAAALIAGGLATLSLLLMGGDVDVIRAGVRAALDQVAGLDFSGVPNAPKLGPAEIEELTSVALKLLPAAVGIWWGMIILLFNFWLAGRITLASGRLQRPWPDLAAITYPSLTPLLLAVSTAAAFMDGLPGLVAVGFSGPLFFAYFLLGLAVVHYVTRGSAWRLFQLSALYVSLVFLYPLSPLAIALFGLAEAVWPMRKISQPPKPPPPT